jgi:ABC-type multidrug transport system fused ATPase/permease subunit
MDQNYEDLRTKLAYRESSQKQNATRENSTGLALVATSEASHVGGIAVSELQFTYASRPDAPVLRELTLQILPRGITCVVGKSGSGKSTLLSVLSGLLQPSAGSVQFSVTPGAAAAAAAAATATVSPSAAAGKSGNSTCVTGEDACHWLRANVGVVRQFDQSLMSGTIRDNIEYGKVSRPIIGSKQWSTGIKYAHNLFIKYCNFFLFSCFSAAAASTSTSAIQAGATQAEVERAAQAASAHAFVMTLPDGYNTEVRGSDIVWLQSEKHWYSNVHKADIILIESRFASY